MTEEQWEEEPLVTTRQAAEILGLHQHWIQTLTKRGTLEAVKMGPLWLVTRSSIEAYRINRRRPGRPPRT